MKNFIYLLLVFWVTGVNAQSLSGGDGAIFQSTTKTKGSTSLVSNGGGVDLEPPTTPKFLNLKLLTSAGAFDITWGESTDNATKQPSYILYSEYNGKVQRYLMGTGRIVRTYLPLGTQYGDPLPPPHHPVSVYVVAYDDAGNFSKSTNVVTIKTGEVPRPISPSTPTGLKVLRKTMSTTTVSWSPVALAQKYRVTLIREDDEVSYITTNNTHTFKNLNSETIYAAYVQAIGAHSIPSARTSTIRFKTISIQPIKLNLLGRPSTHSQAISWKRINKIGMYSKYKISLFQGWRRVRTIYTSSTSYLLSRLASGTEYRVHIQGVYRSTGALSEKSNSLIFNTFIDTRGGGRNSGTRLSRRSDSCVSTSNFSIYPNPTSRNIYVTGLSKGEYSIVDLSGVEVLSGSLEGRKIIDLAPLQSGMYILTIQDGEKIITEKLIKE